MLKKENAGIFILRGQIIHNGHMEIIKQCLKENHFSIFILGSSFSPRTVKNPFNYYERFELLKLAIEEETDRKFGIDYTIKPAVDFIYDNYKWVENIKNIVDNSLNDFIIYEKKIYGHFKDSSSFYLNLFPEYKLVEVENYKGINSTDLREKFFNIETIDEIKDFIPKSNMDFLKKLRRHLVDINYVIEEKKWLDEYKESFYGKQLNSIASDALIFCNNKILLINRKNYPGKHLWAIPGGFKNSNETCLEALIREVKEETSISLSEDYLISHITKREIFDNPNRSIRGSVISIAYLIDCNDIESEEKIFCQAQDDALSFKWFNLTEISNSRELLFEDHYEIILDLLKEKINNEKN